MGHWCHQQTHTQKSNWHYPKKILIPLIKYRKYTLFSFIFSNLKNFLCPVLLNSGYWKTATMEEITVVILVDSGELVSVTWHSHYLMQCLAPRRSSIHFAKLNYVKQLTWKLIWNTSIIWIPISQVSGKHTYSKYIKLFAKKLGSPARARARTHAHTHTHTPTFMPRKCLISLL